MAAWLQCAVLAWPDTALGNRLRAIYWKRRVRMGADPLLLRGSIMYGEPLITAGEHLIMGQNAILDASSSAGIWIGDNVALARDVFVRAAQHRFDDLETPVWKSGHDCARLQYAGAEYSIVIEDGVTVSRGAMVLTGSRIGKGAVIGAGSVVSGPVPDYAIVMGNPGRVVRSRKT